MDKYMCDACGYIYEPMKGDKVGDIAKGTPFEAIPENWVCPLCGAAKIVFVKIEKK